MRWLVPVLFAGFFALPGALPGQSAPSKLMLSVTAERELMVGEGEGKRIERVPAAKSSVGDVLLYTVSYANLGSDVLREARVVDPIPTGTVFLSALPVPATATVEFSADGGRAFSAPPLLLPASGTAPAAEIPPASYSHVRWSFSGPLPSGAHGQFQFKVRVK